MCQRARSRGVLVGLSERKTGTLAQRTYKSGENVSMIARGRCDHIHQRGLYCSRTPACLFFLAVAPAALFMPVL